MKPKQMIVHPYQGHYMEDAFLSFVSHAQQNLWTQYIADEGVPNIGLSPMSQLIDQATGQDVAQAQKFVNWCLVQFGTPDEIENCEGV